MNSNNDLKDTTTDRDKASQKEDMVAILLHIKRMINSHIDEYIKYIISDEILNNGKQERAILEDCTMMRDSIKYISNQLDRPQLSSF